MSINRSSILQPVTQALSNLQLGGAAIQQPLLSATGVFAPTVFSAGPLALGQQPQQTLGLAPLQTIAVRPAGQEGEDENEGNRGPGRGRGRGRGGGNDIFNANPFAPGQIRKHGGRGPG